MPVAVVVAATPPLPSLLVNDEGGECPGGDPLWRKGNGWAGGR